MPALITHHIFGQDAVATLADGIVEGQEELLAFLLGSILLIAGMGLFTLGADMAMSRIGSSIGAKLTRSRKLWLIVGVSLLLGTALWWLSHCCTHHQHEG